MGYNTASFKTNGTTQWIELGNIFSLDHNTPFSIFIIFKTNGSNGYLVSKMDTTPTGYGIYFDAAGRVRVQLYANATHKIDIQTTSSGWNDNEWHWMVLTYDGSGVATGLQLWIDNEFRFATFLQDNLGGNSFINSSKIVVPGKDGGTDLLESSICDISFYSKVLSEEDIKLLYNDGVPFNLSINSSSSSILGWWRPMDTFPSVPDRGGFRITGSTVNMSFDNMSSDTHGGISKSVSSFDSTKTQYMNFGNVYNFERIDSFSVSFWVKTTTTADSWIIAKISATPRGWGVGIYGTDPRYLQIGLFSTSTNRVHVNTTTTTINDGNWHHVLIAYSGTSSVAGLSIWVDDIVQVLNTIANNLTTTIADTQIFNIGCRNSGALCFTGSVAEVSIYGSALTGADSTELYNAGVPLDVTNVSSSRSLRSYWKIGDIPTLENLFNWNSSITQGIGRGIVKIPEELDPMKYMLGAAISWDMAAKYPGPGGFHRFSHFFMQSSFGCHAGWLPTFPTLATPFSVGGWFKMSAANSQPYIFSHNDGTNDGKGWAVGTSSSKIIFNVEAIGNGWARIRVDTVNTYNDGNWHYFLCTHAGGITASSLKIYIDGVEESTTVYVNWSSGSWVPPPGALTAGIRNNTTYSNQFLGWITGLSVWNKELNSVEVIEAYNVGVPIDLRTISTEPNLLFYYNLGGTLEDVPVATLIGDQFDRFSLDTPGGYSKVSTILKRGNYINFGNVFQFERDQSFSIALKFKTFYQAAQIIFCKEDDTRRGYICRLESNGSITWTIANSLSNRQTIQTTSTGFFDGSWHDMVVTYDGSSTAAGMKIYVDGSLEATSVILDALTATIVDNAQFQFGASQQAGINDFFSGKQACVSIFAKELSSIEIAEIYNAGVPIDLRTTSVSNYLIMYLTFNEKILSNHVGQNAGTITDDFPYKTVETEKSWTTLQYTVGIGDSIAITGQKILLDWKNKLAVAGWTVIGSSNGTIYEYEGDTGGGSYGGESTGPYDVWQSRTDVLYKANSSQGPSGWVVLRSPLSTHGQFWLTIWYWSSGDSFIESYVGATKPALRTPATELCPIAMSGTSWHHLSANERFWDADGTSGCRLYFSYSVDGSFIFLRQTRTRSYWGSMTIFMVLPEDRVPQDIQKSVSYHYTWQTTRDNAQFSKWRMHMPDSTGELFASPLFQFDSSNTSGPTTSSDVIFQGETSVTPVYLLSLSGRDYGWPGISTVIGPIPDIYISSANVVSGSTIPEKPPWTYVNVESKYWVPGSEEHDFS